MKKILIIEDNLILRENTAEFLKEEGYEVEAAKDGKAGVKSAQENIPDLVICDIAMPEMNGYQVYEKMQESEETSFIPFIFLTAKTEKDEIRKGMQLGVDDYITKPFEYDDLLKSIEIRLKKQEKINMINKQKITEETSRFKEQTTLLEEALGHVKNKSEKITSSIEYAQQIQTAFLPNDNYIKRVFNDFFIIYKPKDIVSGDFYWFEKKDDIAYFSAIDCTGHGVPGAMMTVIAYNLLDQALNEFNLSSPADILNFMREKINELLKQNRRDTMVSDGMDLSLCAFNQKTYELTFAGAFSPLYLFRNGELIDYKGDLCPVGIYFNNQAPSFTNHRIQLEKEDLIYIFSDGFHDQKGGPKEKKFMKKHFRILLKEIEKLPLAEQKEKLEKEFDKWKGAHEQTDDVLIWAIKIH